MKRSFITLTILLLCLAASGQKNLSQLQHHPTFDWLIDSSVKQMVIYYEAGSWTSDHLDAVKKRLDIPPRTDNSICRNRRLQP